MLTDGLDGGTIPDAPAPTGEPAMTTSADATPAATASAARAIDVDPARAPGWCRITLPFAPLVHRNGSAGAP